MGYIDKPKVLSIHPTIQCDYGCHNCYLKKDSLPQNEKDPSFFLGLIPIAKKLGMTDVAMPLNYVATEGEFEFESDKSIFEIWDKVDRNVYYYEWVRLKCIDEKIDFSVTSNYDFFENYWDVLSFEGVNTVNISINDFVTSTDKKKEKAIEIIRKLSTIVKEVNCNVLISKNMVKQLNNGLAERILEHADSIYLLASQPAYIPYKETLKTVKGLNEDLTKRLEVDIILDNCLRREFGLTGGVCYKHDFIYINPYGEIKECTYDSKNSFVLEKPEDLIKVYEENYPAKPLHTCELVTKTH